MVAGKDSYKYYGTVFMNDSVVEFQNLECTDSESGVELCMMHITSRRFSVATAERQRLVRKSNHRPLEIQGRGGGGGRREISPFWTPKFED